jgi:predicted permease
MEAFIETILSMIGLIAVGYFVYRLGEWNWRAERNEWRG